MSAMSKAHKLALAFLIIAAPLVIRFVLAQFSFAANSDIFDGAYLNLYAFLKFRDPELFIDDYAADYIILGTPIGFLYLQQLWAQFADLEILHRALPIILWLACAPMVFFSAKRLGGNTNAIITLTMYLSTSVFMHRFAAAVPHAFAFVFCWWGISALLSGRVISLSICTIISAIMYPIITPISGLCLAGFMLFPTLFPSAPRRLPFSDFRLLKKFIFLAVVAIISAACVMPTFHNMHSGDFGRALVAPADTKEFPEITATLNPNPIGVALWEMYGGQTYKRLGGAGTQNFTIFTFFLLIFGAFLGNKSDQRTKTLMFFIQCSLVLCAISLFADYFNAYRYITYSVPVCTTLFLPLTFRRISRKFSPNGYAANIFVALSFAYIFCTATANPESSGYRRSVTATDKAALEYIKTLPKNALVAGWPGDKASSIIDFVPYQAKRKVLVSFFQNYGSNLNYVMIMRERMNALIEAYFSDDVSKLIMLRDKFHVDYMVVQESDFSKDTPPDYQIPFKTKIKDVWDANPEKHFVLLELASKNHLYASDGIYIIDLTKIKSTLHD